MSSRDEQRELGPEGDRGIVKRDESSAKKKGTVAKESFLKLFECRWPRIVVPTR